MVRKKQAKAQQVVRPSEELDVSLDTEDIVEETPSQPEPPTKKRARTSKRDIPDYKFSDDQVLEIAEFVRLNTELYDKTHVRWCDPKHKEDLWKELAATFPDCTFLQVRKFFEARRTDFGKIEKRENKSGAPKRQRTTREQSIMQTWSFLKGHIAHEATQPSDTFDRPSTSEAARPTTPGDGDVLHSSGDESGLSAQSIARRKSLVSRQQRTPLRSPSPASPRADAAIYNLLQSATRIMQKRDLASEDEIGIDNFLNHLRDRLRLVHQSNRHLLYTRFLDMITELEEPPAEPSKIADPRKRLDRLMASYTPASTSASTSTTPSQPPPVPAAAPPLAPPATPAVPAPGGWSQQYQWPQQQFPPYPVQQYPAPAYQAPQQQPPPPTPSPLTMIGSPGWPSPVKLTSIYQQEFVPAPALPRPPTTSTSSLNTPQPSTRDDEESDKE